MTELEASECVIMTALNDGVLSQRHVNSILANFGVVSKKEATNGEATDGEADNLSAYSGVSVPDVHAKFQLGAIRHGCDISLAEHEHSPRQLAKCFSQRNGNDEEKKACKKLSQMPYSKEDRLKIQDPKKLGPPFAA
jgi:hypothetical protein